MEGPQCRANPALAFCGKVLVVGSVQLAPGAADANAADLYDPRTGVWVGAAPTGQLRVSPGVVQIDGPQCDANTTRGACGKVLVVGGNSGDVPDTAELYDPASNTWSWAHPLLFSHFLWFSTVLLQGSRCGSLCGDVLVAAGGGSDGDKAEVYDPIRDSWTPTGSLIQRRAEHVTVLLNGPACTASPAPGYCGDVLVAGGRIGNPSSLTTPTAELFDPAATDAATGAAGAWRPTASLAPDGSIPYAPEQASAALLTGPRCDQHCGQALVAGGVGVTSTIGNPEYPTAELYDPTSGTWTVSARMAHPRDNYAGVLLPGGDFLAAGGESGGGSTAELYDPSGSGAWTAADSLPNGGFDFAIAVLPSGPSSVCGTLCGRALVTGARMVNAKLFEGPPGVGLVDPDPVPLLGGSIALSGGGFTTADSVLIDGVPIACPSAACSQDARSPDASLHISVPAHAAGTVTLVVHNEIGNSPPFLLRYADPLPTLAALSPGCGPLAGGTSVTISGDHFVPAAVVDVAGAQTAATVLSGTAIQITVPPAPEPGGAGVTVTTTGGTSSPLTFSYPCPGSAESGPVSQAGLVPPGSSTTVLPPAHPGPPAAAQAPPASALSAAPQAPAGVSLQGPAVAPGVAPPPAQPVVGVAGVATDTSAADPALAFRMVRPSGWDVSPVLLGAGAVLLAGFAGCLVVTGRADPARRAAVVAPVEFRNEEVSM